MRILNKIAQSQYVVPEGTPLYRGDWDGKSLPSPSWETLVSYLDTRSYNISPGECDPRVVEWI